MQNVPKTSLWRCDDISLEKLFEPSTWLRTSLRDGAKHQLLFSTNVMGFGKSRSASYVANFLKYNFLCL